jgi:hypothetical protein
MPDFATLWLDKLLRRRYRVFEFTDDPECIFRLGLENTSHPIHLPDKEIPKDAPVLGLHLWNEQVPRMPNDGPNMRWGIQMVKRVKYSFGLVAQEIRHNPDLRYAQAVGGDTILFSQALPGEYDDLFTRLGFTIFPYHRPKLGRFGEFFENLYTWWLMRSFNLPSAQRRQLFHLERKAVWMSIERLLSLYPEPAGEDMAVRQSKRQPADLMVEDQSGN